MGTEEESGEHESDNLAMGSGSDGDIHGHNERRNIGTEKRNDDDNMKNGGRESLSNMSDDDRSRHRAADYRESEKDNSQEKGNGTCRLYDEKNSRHRKKT